MSVKRTPDGRWACRYYVAGRGSPRRQRTFDRKRDAELFLAEVRRRKALGDLATFEAADRTVTELAVEWWRKYAVPNLADHTLDKYERILASHIRPRLGHYRLREVTPEVLMDFRARLEQAGVGRDSVRVSLVIVQAMFRQAIKWRWVQGNPVVEVEKPSGRRERAVVALAPAQVEAIRQVFLAERKVYAAAMVSVAAYAGLRCPEELLALEVRHVGRQTLLVEQRNIGGVIVPGQKVKGFRPRAVDLPGPVRQDVAEYLMARGRPGGRELLFPRADGGPWRRHDYNNWRRRAWHPAREAAGVEALPPYDLRHAFASLQIRAGMSIPELAEQMGHSPQMTVGTYTHVIRELKGQAPMPAEGQILEARGREVDVRAEGGGAG